MLLRSLLVLHYIAYCARYLTIPWRYFQLNADHFNSQKKIFSKQDLYAITPKEWRLRQYIDDPNINPQAYPIFAKPEWGQNSSGVLCIRDHLELQQLRKSQNYQRHNYLIQEAATGRIEYEILIIKRADADPATAPGIDSGFAVMSLTQVLNNSTERYPVNGIYNASTRYRDITTLLTQEQKISLWQELRRMGDFAIARYSVKADSIAELNRKNFRLIEVNLFVPMPLSLLSENLTTTEKYQLIISCTRHLAQLARQLNNKKNIKPIFFNKLIASLRCKHERIPVHNENHKTNHLQMDQ